MKKSKEQSQEDEVKEIDLTKVEDCRFFLNNLRVDGRHVTAFYTSKGRKVTVPQMSDEEAIYFANQIHEDLFGGLEYIPTDIYRMDHH